MTIRNTKETFGEEILSQNEVDQICDTHNISVKNNCFVFGPHSRRKAENVGVVVQQKDIEGLEKEVRGAIA